MDENHESNKKTKPTINPQETIYLEANLNLQKNITNDLSELRISFKET